LWQTARIPFRNIRNIDMRGDEYYPMPHLYCAFADDGMPYEAFRYILMGEDYDTPLYSSRQIIPAPVNGHTETSKSVAVPSSSPA